MIELSYPTIAIGSILFTILGFLLKTALVHFLAKGRDRENRQIASFNNAAADFSEVFDNILDLLREPIPDGVEFFTAPEMVYEILQSTFTTQRNAVARFRRILSGKELIGFSEAWEQYYYPTENENLHDEEKDFYFFSGYISQSKEEEKEKRLKAFNHIETLLSFAKQK